MVLDQILIEENGEERLYTLYDKILFQNQNIFVYLNEESHGDIKIVFLKYDPIHESLSEEIHGYSGLLLFYHQLNF